MKKISLILFLITSVFASNNQEIINRLNKLEQENKKQSKLIEQLSSRMEKINISSEKGMNAELFGKNFDALSDRIDGVETATILNKIKLDLNFRVKMNNIQKKMADGKKLHSNNLWTTKLMIGMKSDISDRLKFHGRLSMYKYWADSTLHPYALYDNMQGRVPATSAIFVERAYVDWYFRIAGIPSALTIGRQPSSDGPSHQFAENTSRKATYSALLFDGASDGIVYTADISKTIGIKKARFRVAYGKGFQNDETKVGVTNAFLGSSDTSLKDTNVVGVFFESQIANVNNSLFQIGYTNMSNIVANSMEYNTTNNKNIGNIQFLSAMAEAMNFKDSGFDLFAHFAYSSAKPNASVYNYKGHKFGLLKDDTPSTSKRDGNAYWIGGRYTTQGFYGIKIGAEYNHGSKYWVNATQGAYDIYNKLATRGDAYEIYTIYPISRYGFLKFGALYIDYDYTKSGWYQGEPKKISSLSSAMKANTIDSLTSLYLQFSVKF